MFGEIFSRRVFIGKKTCWQWLAVRLALTIAKHSAIQNPTFAPISSMLTITKNTLSLSFKTCFQELPRNSFISQPCIGFKKMNMNNTTSRHKENLTFSEYEMRYKKMLVLHNYSFQSWVLYIMYIWERHQSLKKMLKELPLQRRETLYWIVWKFTGVLNISRDNFWTCQLWWNINTRSAERSCLIFSKAWGIVWNWYYKVTDLIFSFI